MKILVVRFSSIGDVVLTSPILRAIKASFPEGELHFLVKAKFLDAVRHNPRIDKIHVLERGTINTLRQERYDWVLDLQKNVRSTGLTSFLGARRVTIDKQNFKKWRMVRLKTRETVPHIVERYGEALKPLNISLDDGGLEYFIAGQSEIAADDYFKGERRIPVGMALGANYATKRWPLWTELASLIDPAHYVPVLLGGPMDVDAADAFVRRFPTAINAVGRCNLNVSAALVKRCRVIVTPDTGLMHIAAALGTPIVSLWGNTVPAFGMYPYRARFVALENALPCRPCSKLGFAACPRQHFHCMTLTRPESVWNAALKVMAQESA